MNRNEARKLAETVSLEELKQMFANAQLHIKDWEQVSRVNKGMTKGAAYNILSKGMGDHQSADEIHVLGKKNMIWEFGEYLPGYEKPVKDKKQFPKPVHQKPNFTEFYVDREHTQD